ncbi:hypothetical protein GCM10010129_16350 [Streptomyces fumigatiscleroticus]|nr:hypothetical protein GCM10010129_16350 [Streptomyces fumigatiscleroticus]
MRNVDPDDLDRLARLLDGKGGVQDGLDEAFTRASRLGVSGKLTAVKPLRSWVTDTAPDLRKRAAIARLEDGDPDAGLRWAGFDVKDIVRAGIYAKAPGILLIANAVATSGDAKAEAFRRKPRESLDDWVDRLRAHGIADSIPALKPYEEEIKEILGAVGDVTSTVHHGGLAAFHGVNTTKVLVGNSLAEGALNSWKLKAADVMVRLHGRYSWAPTRLADWGNSLARWRPPVRSLTAPGTWLPGKLASAFSGSAAYQDASRVPFVASQASVRVGEAFDELRRSRLMNSRTLLGMTGNRLINGLVGSDKIARMYGGFSHSGQEVTRAGNASYWKVAKNAFADNRLVGKGRLTSAVRGLKTAAKMGGALRGAGIISGVYSTLSSGVNVYVQGNPRKAFEEKGAGYVADVAEVGFNASLTLATVAPNPVTLGAVAVTGGIYAGAKVVEHWGDIKKGAKKAREWVGGKAGDLGKAVAKSKVNPMNWF